jgi:hypothetical protein
MAVSCENANCHSVTVRDLTRLSQKSSRIQRFYNYFKFFQNHYPPQEVKLLWLHCIHLLPCVSPLQSSVNGASMHRSLPPGPLRSIGDCFTWMSVKPPPDYFFASDLDLWPVHRVLFFSWPSNTHMDILSSTGQTLAILHLCIQLQHSSVC